MAFGTAAGYGNLPSGNFAPEIFSQKVLKFFRRASVVEDITNTDYAGEIENFGDTVRIIKEPTVTVSSYTRGSVVNAQDLADDQITMVVDNANAFAFKIDDIEERHSHVNFEALATSSGAFALKRKYDANVLQAISDGAGIAGADDASLSGGLTTTNTALGTASSPINVETDDAGINLMLLMARTLDDQSVPEENRWFVAPPIFYEKMFQAGNKMAEVQVTGDATSPLRNGLAVPGLLAGFRCYKSTALNSTAGTDQVTLSGVATDASENIVLAGHMSSTSTASHIAKTEVVRSTESFSDVIRGLHVFGRKVLRPEAVVRGVIDFA
ncbi:hypothetical protein [Hyphomonas sp.]|uniref:hypothetical protein n=1 Tax=Hyphomonas sp. TaxID=87 RepID=UPI000C8AEBB2|nr:hypothetical protein [Hyphomonas sp.]MAL46641.1 hypothetical protein [Hyphomonas sp.]